MCVAFLSNFLIGYDPSYQLVFYACWSDYEESGWLLVLEREGRYYYQDGGYCVMDDEHCELYPFQPVEMPQEDILAMMLEWEGYEEYIEGM